MARLVACFVAATAVMAAASRSNYKGRRFSEHCDGVRARTDAGLICGEEREYQLYDPLYGSWEPVRYSSFRGIPYAKPPLGELRFQELRPAERWAGYLNASEEGPTCMQYDYFFDVVTEPRGMDEDCITVNLHVPTEALKAQEPNRILDDYEYNKGLPILVFIHGGGFQFGSGDGDLYGPEYMVSKGFMVITFNYRLGPFGFLSLNTSTVPGNAGLRDMVTLLNWVQLNCGHFGGNIRDVTIAGQSAGATAVHLLTLSPATKGLFHRGVMMSGSGVRSFFSPSPSYNNMMANPFFTLLNITTTDTDEIYRQLITMPVEDIQDAYEVLLDACGLTVFLPTIESAFEGVTRIIDDDPEVLLAQGRGKDIPLVIGYTAAECEAFRQRFDEVDLVHKMAHNPQWTVPPVILFSKNESALPDIIRKIHHRYFDNSNQTLDNFVRYCSEAYIVYPALYTAQRRADIGGASVYLYQFQYEGQYRALQRPGYEYSRTTHAEDLTYLMKINSGKVPFDQKMIDTSRDGAMQRFMQSWFSRFIRSGSPANSANWPRMQPNKFLYQDIKRPGYRVSKLSHEQKDVMSFFRDIYA